eukprot:SAG31_NODE_2350_length_5893_cov_2.633414_4_plen_94_part_00
MFSHLEIWLLSGVFSCVVITNGGVFLSARQIVEYLSDPSVPSGEAEIALNEPPAAATKGGDVAFELELVRCRIKIAMMTCYCLCTAYLGVLRG